MRRASAVRRQAEEIADLTEALMNQISVYAGADEVHRETGGTNDLLNALDEWDHVIAIIRRISERAQQVERTWTSY